MNAFAAAAAMRRRVRVLSGMKPRFESAGPSRGDEKRRLRALARFNGEIKLGRPCKASYAEKIRAEKLQLKFEF